MPGDYYEYVCSDCNLSVIAETWDAGELPKCWCPSCDSVMEIERADSLANPDGDVE